MKFAPLLVVLALALASTSGVRAQVSGAPVIASLSSGPSVTVGTNVTLFVSVNGTTPFTYQWRKDGTALAGATANFFSLVPALVTDAGSYTVVITNAVGSVTSNPIILSVAPAVAPTLNSSPRSTSVYAGQSLNLSSSFSGSSPMTFVWHKDAVPLAGATNSSYAKANLQPADAGSYTVTAANSAGSVTSSAAFVTVLPIAVPVITTQPRDETVDTAGTFSLYVSVNNGGSPESYQWKKDGVTLVGATSPSYGKSGAQAADAGSYTVTVTNAVGSVTSVAARVTVRSPLAPVVSISSSGTRVLPEGGLSMRGSVSGTPPFTYQWFKDGALLPGETQTLFQRSTVQPSDAGTFTFVATNAQGSSASDPLRITILSPRPPEILGHPVSQRVEQSGGLNLSVNVSGTPPLTYQWRKDGALIASATSSNFSVTNRAASSDSGSYTVTVSNPYGSVVSEPALVDVGPPAAPVIKIPLQDRVYREGTYFSLQPTLVVSGNPLTYEWKKDGVVLTGNNTNSPSLYFNGLLTDAGTYTLTVTNPVGSVTTSAKITLLPVAAPEIVLQPSHASILPGETYYGLSVSLAYVDGKTTYQWFRDGVALSGATSSALTLVANDALRAGAYKVVVTNPAGSVTSTEGIVTVDAANARPLVLASVGGVSITGGMSANIRVTTSATYPMQWQKNGVNIPNAISTALVFNSFSVADEGSYTAVFTTPSGPVTTRPALLKIRDAGAAPQIVSPPYPQHQPLGNSVTWSIAAEGERPFTYQWRKDGVPIPGATSEGYYISSLVPSHAGKYSVVVTNRLGAVTSADAPLTVWPETPPVIRLQPPSQTVALNGTFSPYVALVTDMPATYQWTKDGVVIPGVTYTNYSTQATAATAGRYAVTITNGAGSVRSNDAVMTLGNRTLEPPTTALTFPQLQTVFIGNSVTLASNLTGATSYQWRKNGVDVPGATAATLTLSIAQAADSGTYVALGRNADGAGPSMPIVLTVQVPPPGLPIIATQPASITVLPGNTATFTAGVGSNPAATYQWFRNGVAIPGATAVVLTLTNVQTAQAGRYTLVATNSFGSATSAEALLTLGTPITFTDSPRSQSVSAGAPLTLVATIQSPGSVSYQWKKNGVAVPGATASTLTFSPVRASDDGVYTLVVSNPEGSVESVPATLTVANSVFAGTYYGGFGTGDSLALQVSPEGTGTMLGVLTNFSEAIIGRGFAIAADGSFTFGTGAARSYGAYRVSGDTVTGKITGPTVTGRVVGRDVAFSGGLQTPGATATLAGYYQAVPVSGMVGEVHAVAAPDGTLQLLAINPTGVRQSRGALSPTGAFSLSQPPLLYSGNLAAATGALTGSLQMLPAPAVTFATAPAPGGPERLANVSARGLAGSDSRALIAGFVVSGTAPKDVLIRAVGPALTGFGVAGALANPRLKLFKGNTSLLENDDWGLGGFATQIAGTTARVGGFPFAAGSQDAAVIARLDPGSYSAQVTGATTATGVALVEVYDAADTLNATRLINLSTRGEVGTGGDILIVGVVVTGNAPKKILLRGIGPGLAAFGVPGTVVDPQLKLYRGSQLVAENDNWSAGADAALIADAAVAVGAFALPAASKDAALLLYLAPGTYSAQLSGAASTTGVGLVEAYEVP